MLCEARCKTSGNVLTNHDSYIFLIPSGTSPKFADLGRWLNLPGGTAHNDGDEANPMGDRHLDGSNYLFVDGHVKWLHYTQAVEGTETPVNMGHHIARDGMDYNTDGYLEGRAPHHPVATLQLPPTSFALATTKNQRYIGHNRLVLYSARRFVFALARFA